MRTIIVAAATLTLVACAGADPYIADLEEDKVIVAAYGLQAEPEATKVAEQGCAIHNRAAFGPINVTTTPNSPRWSYLYACR